MKYIEELQHGDTFLYSNTTYVLTNDFKKNGDKLAISLYDGSNRWFKSNELITSHPIYILDENNNTIPVKHKPPDHGIQNTAVL